MVTVVVSLEHVRLGQKHICNTFGQNERTSGVLTQYLTVYNVQMGGNNRAGKCK